MTPPDTPQAIRRLTPRRWVGTLAVLVVLLVVTIVACILIGSESTDLGEQISNYRAGGWMGVSDYLREIRVPRVLLAALAGWALGLSGAVYQAVLRNPLAEPYLLGIAGGASAGAVLIPFLGISLGSLLAGPVFSFVGALVALGLLLLLTRMQGGLRTFNLILTGVILGAFFSATILFVISRSEAHEAQGIWYRLVGSLWFPPSWDQVAVLLASVGVGSALIFPMARPLNILALGDDQAATLGISIGPTKVGALVLASLVTGVTVAICGPIGFVGLIVPHALRILLGADHRLLLPAAGLGGGIFLAATDTAARSIWAPEQVPVGVITALLGGPFFIGILIRRRVRGDLATP